MIPRPQTDVPINRCIIGNVTLSVLAILQNQWFRDPARMRAILDRGLARGLKRHDFIARTLFMGCRTGVVLRQSLGVDWCRHIVWEEASPEMGGFSGSRFVANSVHLQSVLDEIKPDVVVALGKIATDAMIDLVPREKLIVGPHPVARGIDTVNALKIIRGRLDALSSERIENAQRQARMFA